MTGLRKFIPQQPVPRFSREFFGGADIFTAIGGGELGGKAAGLAFARDLLAETFAAGEFADVELSIPRLTVLTTDVFDAFMRQNNLFELAHSDLPDDRIALAFQKADFPAAFIGDLMALMSKVRQPLAVRSSSLLEDALDHPFAGVYGTKMIPNNQFDVETRFRKLIEAIKFVYASAFFAEAKAYIAGTDRSVDDEKMAVIIQEVVGLRHGDRFYPHISGVAKSYNYYPTGRAKPEQGVVSLALGLGKTIVDGGVCWTYSPAFAQTPPPFGSERDMLQQTQLDFWAVNMGKPPAFDPIRETEYLVHPGLADAEDDKALRFIASTFDAESGRLQPGVRGHGPRVLTFAPILVYDEFPLNPLVRKLLASCTDAVGAPVEMEFAVSLDPEAKPRARFGFLQVRPMLVSDEHVEIDPAELSGDKVLVASEAVLGNGTLNTLLDVVYVRPDIFESRFTRIIADEIAEINRRLMDEKRHCLLLGFGRWGSSDPWLGIPVNWSQISAARAIVETTLTGMNVDPSQGSHFFHNLSSFRVSYFQVHHDGPYPIAWDWFDRQQRVSETRYVRHARLSSPLLIRVDGRSGRGVIRYE